MLSLNHLQPDWSLIGMAELPLSLLVLALSLGLLAGSLTRQRNVVKADLARIFEQLDLLRFDAQQTDTAALSPVPSTSAVNADLKGGIGDYYAAAQLAARGSTAAEIAERCGIVSGEARVLVALQQARIRRVEAA